MTERFKNAYDALYGAFMDGNLSKGTCTACAVGNIIAHSLNGKIIKEYIDFHGSILTDFKCDVNNTFWSQIFITINFEQFLIEDTVGYEDKIKKIKQLTGYDYIELSEIEYAFETNTKICFTKYCKKTDLEIMEDQFDGLMAVMDVMIKLDEIKDGDVYKQTFKNKFSTTHHI